MISILFIWNEANVVVRLESAAHSHYSFLDVCVCVCLSCGSPTIFAPNMEQRKFVKLHAMRMRNDSRIENSDVIRKITFFASIQNANGVEKRLQKPMKWALYVSKRSIVKWKYAPGNSNLFRRHIKKWPMGPTSKRTFLNWIPFCVHHFQFDSAFQTHIKSQIYKYVTNIECF